MRTQLLLKKHQPREYGAEKRVKQESVDSLVNNFVNLLL